MRIKQHGQPSPVGKRLVQQLDLLLRQLQLLKDKTGDVAAWPRQAGDVALDEDNGDRSGRVLRRRRRRGAACENQGDLTVYEISDFAQGS